MQDTVHAALIILNRTHLDMRCVIECVMVVWCVTVVVCDIGGA